MRILFSALLVITVGLPCLAALGDTVASVAADQQKFQMRRQIRQAQNYSVHTMTGDDGTVINEFVSASGTVFGVSWQGPGIPDLSQLLGGHFSTFQAQVLGESKIRARRRGAVVGNGNLIVESGGHQRDFRGRAYLNDQLPSGVTAEVIQ
jgi:hypothetical protein